MCIRDRAAEGLSDVTLKNGIVTIDATADKTYVTADEFNSYIVKGSSAEVEDLALDSDSTFGASGSEGYALAAGDYVIVVLDDDNYITCLLYTSSR